ncbi:MAG: xanthine dehydrogenase family protein molybdopterin-binding subunit [Proteobacteria bacterium]|nr:xanthine dehydrogenase family protein molybdopterin-binding subunit [Pseudomonadota bacterium]
MDLIQNCDRADTPDKCSGETLFIRDMQFPGVLDAVTVCSASRRANILKVELPEMPKGYFTVDASDIPGRNHVVYFRDPCPYFAEGRVNYIGQPIMLVVGPDIRLVRKLAGEVCIEYDEIPPIKTIDDALSGNFPPLHKDNNVYAEEAFHYGEVEQAFSEAAEIFETVTLTGYQEHLYMEPQGVVAVPDGDRITVYASTQGPHAVRLTLAGAFGWDPGRFRVCQTPVGGGFGGKIELPLILAGHAAFAALKCGRPVRLAYSREEDMLATTKRHPSRAVVRTALNKEKQITAIDIDVVFQAGGYALSCGMVLDNGLKKATGVYHFPAARVRGRAVATNNPMGGALRGFGAPQIFFALETHMNALARKLGVDPLAFKANYFIRQGNPTLTGGTYHFHVSLPEVVEAVKKISDYKNRITSLPRAHTRLFGIGQALFNFGAPFSIDSKMPAGNRSGTIMSLGLLKCENGTIEILSELVDMGQGLHTVFRKIVAKTLDIPIERVAYDNVDTDHVPPFTITGASMSVVAIGRTLKNVAEKLKPRLNEPGEIRIIEQYQQPPHVNWDAAKQQGDPFHSYVWGAVIAEVEVDTVTWQVLVRHLWMAIDIGTAIDRRIVRGQIDGGVMQGLGYALLESIPPDTMIASLADYIIPTSLDAPAIESILVENLYLEGPYGAKCTGEPPLVGMAPAIADAVANACGVEITQLPISPEYLMKRVIEKP